jgi:hypothetical protein
MGRWKLILNDRTGQEILYDLESDKVEMRNIAGENPDVVRQLRMRLSRWEREMIPPLWPRVMDYRITIDGEEYIFAL